MTIFLTMEAGSMMRSCVLYFILLRRIVALNSFIVRGIVSKETSAALVGN